MTVNLFKIIGKNKFNHLKRLLYNFSQFLCLFIYQNGFWRIFFIKSINIFDPKRIKIQQTCWNQIYRQL